MGEKAKAVQGVVESVGTEAAAQGLQASGVPAPVTRVVMGTALRHKKGTAIGVTFLSLSPLIIVGLVALMLLMVVGATFGASPSAWSIPASATATGDIPKPVLALYQEVGSQDRVPWTVLAAIGELTTQNGTVNPYDPTAKPTSNWPTVSPPIGGGTGQGVGPMLLEPTVADSLTRGQPQNFQESVSAVGAALATSAQQVAERAGLDFTTELTEPLSKTAGFWTQAVTTLPIVLPAGSCDPPTGSSVDEDIEYIWTCKLVGAQIHLEGGPTGRALTGSDAASQLVSEALGVSWAYSRWGASLCTAFPLPSFSTVAQCDVLDNISSAADLVIKAAESPVTGRAQSEWQALPGVVVSAPPPAAPVASPTTLSSGCEADVATAVSQLPEPGPYSALYPGGPANPAEPTAWSSGALASLRTEAACEVGTGKGATPVDPATWQTLVATVANQILDVDEATQPTGSDGLPETVTDLTGLVDFLDTAANVPAAASPATTLVPRLASPEVSLIFPTPPAPLPIGTSGFAATAISCATVLDGTGQTSAPSGGTTSGANACSAATAVAIPPGTSVSGIPPGWIQWSQAAVSAECPGLSPYVLMAIGDHESSMGQSTLPGVQSGANYGGAEGPMQFEPATFAAYAVSVNGDTPSPYNAEDALFAAANYLCHNGAATNLDPALFQYCGGDADPPSSITQCNQYIAWVHADAVKLQAEVQAAGAAGGSGATIPPGALGVFVQAALSQVGVPYVWGGETAGSGFDCSGLVEWAALQAGGLGLSGLGTNGSHGATAQGLYDETANNPVSTADLSPGDLLFYGTTGNVEHVGIYVGGGQMVDAPHTGADIRVEAYNWPGFYAATAP